MEKWRKRSRIFLGLLPLLCVVMIWVFRPYPVIDESKVHPSLRGRNDSTVCEWSSFGDGGSMGIRVLRPDGDEVVLCMSNSLDHSFFERGQLYIGAPHFLLPGARKITGYDHTKFVLAKLLARRLPEDPGLREEIALMTKCPRDWVSLVVLAGPLDVWEVMRLPGGKLATFMNRHSGSSEDSGGAMLEIVLIVLVPCYFLFIGAGYVEGVFFRRYLRRNHPEIASLRYPGILKSSIFQQLTTLAWLWRRRYVDMGDSVLIRRADLHRRFMAIVFGMTMVLMAGWWIGGQMLNAGSGDDGKEVPPRTGTK